jgi:TRAP-type C4-dicarboxylate transport system permease small subunit
MISTAALLLRRLNTVLAVASGIAIGVAGCVLTWEATARYLFKIPSDWQDEMSIFLLVGATFLSAAWVQQYRGHVGIQALSSVLPPRADAIRRYVSDVLTFVFCTFFSWKSWTLLIEAVHDGQTSNSAWGAPLWIPYGAMATGMSVLALQVLLQLLTRESLHIAPQRQH